MSRIYEVQYAMYEQATQGSDPGRMFLHLITHGKMVCNRAAPEKEEESCIDSHRKEIGRKITPVYMLVFKEER